MAEPKVLNKYKDSIPEDSVYIGRPTQWGNPFIMTDNKMETRELSIKMYAGWIKKNPTLISAAMKDLRGKDLVCFCAPLPCHGDILIQIANS